MRKHEAHCVYCGNRIYPSNATWEHIIPLSKGGANCHANKKTCCDKCNNMRDNLSFEAFREKIEKLMLVAEHKFKWQTMLVNLEIVENYATRMGKRLYKKPKLL